MFFLEVVTGGNVYFLCGFIEFLEVGVAHLIPPLAQPVYPKPVLVCSTEVPKGAPL